LIKASPLGGSLLSAGLPIQKRLSLVHPLDSFHYQISQRVQGAVEVFPEVALAPFVLIGALGTYSLGNGARVIVQVVALHRFHSLHDVGKVKIYGTGAAPLETAASIVVSVNAIGANALFERLAIRL
jgi:hypothetical protein